MSEKAGLSVKKSEGKEKGPVTSGSKTDLSQSMEINSPVQQVLDLQRTIGNQAVTRLIQSGVLQAKLTIGQPGDIYEQEADRVAEQVMRMSEGSLVNGQWSLARKEKDLVQARGNCGQSSDISSCVESHINALKGSGHPLSPATRDYFEPRFRSDFSQVRIHTGLDAAAISREINARAFTFGRDVFFGAGQYSPSTSWGKRLIAHELTHVVQQRNAPRVSQLSQGTHNQYHNDNVKGIDSHPNYSPKNLNISTKRPLTSFESPDIIRRVRWTPNVDTGKDGRPWGPGGPVGDILTAATDAGTNIDIWRPHDGITYWCHGYTFGGSTASGGPYSIGGNTVPTVLNDDGWKHSFTCVAGPGDILVFYSDSGKVLHSGIIRSVSEPGGKVDENASTLQSKWGQQALRTDSWLVNANKYGGYRCYSKSPAYGPCSANGDHELP